MHLNSRAAGEAGFGWITEDHETRHDAQMYGYTPNLFGNLSIS